MFFSLLLTGLLCIPNCEQVMTSNNSSSVPNPPIKMLANISFYDQAFGSTILNIKQLTRTKRSMFEVSHYILFSQSINIYINKCTIMKTHKDCVKTLHTCADVWFYSKSKIIILIHLHYLGG